MPTEPPVKGERKRASFIHSRLRNRRMEQTRRSFTTSVTQIVLQLYSLRDILKLLYTSNTSNSN